MYIEIYRKMQFQSEVTLSKAGAPLAKAITILTCFNLFCFNLEVTKFRLDVKNVLNCFVCRDISVNLSLYDTPVLESA